PALSVRAARKHLAEDAPCLRRNIVGMLKLRVVARKSFMHDQILEHPVVVFPQLRLCFGRRCSRLNGRYPELGFALRLQRRRRVESGDAIDTTQEGRCWNNLEVVAWAECDQVFLEDK